jgi:hypothetical protein
MQIMGGAYMAKNAAGANDEQRILGILPALSNPFMLRDLASRIGLVPHDGYTALRKVCNGLVRKGLLIRLKHGHYDCCFLKKGRKGMAV